MAVALPDFRRMKTPTQSLNLPRLLLPLALAAAFLTGCASCPCKHFEKSEALFNGETLDGWKDVSADPAVPMQHVWLVRDGAIFCEGKPMGYLYTEQVFTNYRLHVEYRWAPGSTPDNSGIFGRINGPPRPLPRCLETQLKHGDAGDLYCFHGMSISGDPARFKFIPKHEIGGDLRGVTRIRGAEKRAGEWNHVFIEVNGPNATVWMNGRKVNEATGIEVVAGPVGLQSEGGRIEFRAIRIERLP